VVQDLDALTQFCPYMSPARPGFRTFNDPPLYSSLPGRRLLVFRSLT